jgi:hypothetical protein
MGLTEHIAYDPTHITEIRDWVWGAGARWQGGRRGTAQQRGRCLRRPPVVEDAEHVRRNIMVQVQ